MSQRRASNSSAAKTYARVFRGGAAAVTEAVRRETGEGLLLPCGPFRYPYAAIIELLRQAGLFHEPTGETATDPVLSREGLVPGLSRLLVQEIVIGVPWIEGLDGASRALLGDLAGLAQLRRDADLPAAQLALGVREDASDFSEHPEAVPSFDHKLATPTTGASELLRVIAAAPHPAREPELRKAARISWNELADALRELNASGHIMVGERIGLGPGGIDTTPTNGREWLNSKELRLPHARLGSLRSAEPELGIRLAQFALEQGDARGAASCFEIAGATDKPEYALALAMLGRLDSARAIAQLAEPSASVAAELARLNAFDADQADAALRRFEKHDPVRARALRAQLMLHRGQADRAWNLLRRTSRPMLEERATKTRRLHWLALARCALARDDHKSARRALESARGTLRNLRDEREWCELQDRARDPDATPPSPFGDRLLALALRDLDPCAFRERAARFEPEVGRWFVQNMDTTTDEPETPLGFHDPQAAWSWLAGEGAALLAIRVGERCAIYPPGASVRPGLEARLAIALDRLVENPEGVLHTGVEFDNAGPFGGDIVLTLRGLGEFGPAIVLFRQGKEAEARRVLKRLKHR